MKGHTGILLNQLPLDYLVLFKRVSRFLWEFEKNNNKNIKLNIHWHWHLHIWIMWPNQKRLVSGFGFPFVNTRCMEIDTHAWIIVSYLGPALFLNNIFSQCTGMLSSTMDLCKAIFTIYILGEQWAGSRAHNYGSIVLDEKIFVAVETRSRKKCYHLYESNTREPKEQLLELVNKVHGLLFVWKINVIWF